ncbi:hypothetical protein [Variovorax paradoxus]|uniref:hypothetical protein n=1 Tax=Variovorax paradoxus TaxID=34073 RepID=UPI00285D1650|nr:hypothetical protein [Variovorax paradoxus]MDR6453927.1 hypothetical protein [Variovorax paradoxus]
MSALFHTPLTAPRQFVGAVDATHERVTPCPRTLEQAFGPASDSGVLVPMDADKPLHPSEKLVTRASALAGLFVIALLIFERIAS